jgi:hypothetical protein
VFQFSGAPPAAIATSVIAAIGPPPRALAVCDGVTTFDEALEKSKQSAGLSPLFTVDLPAGHDPNYVILMNQRLRAAMLEGRIE